MWRWSGLLAIFLCSSCSERVETKRSVVVEGGGGARAVAASGGAGGSRAEAGAPSGSQSEGGVPSGGKAEAGTAPRCHDDAGPPPVADPGCSLGSPGCVCGWGKPVLLADSVEPAHSYSSVVADRLGNAFVAWNEEGSGGTVTNMFARFDAPTARWTDAEDTKISEGYVRVAPDARGNALLVGLGVFSVYDLKAGTWSALQEMPPGEWGQFGFAADGSAIAAAFEQYRPAIATVYDSCSRTWSQPRTLQATLPGSPAVVAMDEEGNAIVAQTDLTVTLIAGGRPAPPVADGVSACRFDGATRAWSPCAKVYTEPMADYSTEVALMGVVAGPPGRAGLWLTDANGAPRTSEFDPGAATWTSAAALQSSYASLKLFSLFSNPSGEAFLWGLGYEDAARKTPGIHLASRRDVAHGTWGPFVSVAPEAPLAYPIRASVAPSGDAIVVFSDQDGAGKTSDQFVVRYAAQSGEWTPQERFTNTDDGSEAESVSVSTGLAGSAFATWLELLPATKSRKVWVNRWTCRQNDS
jgi:hypothetical protein